MSKKERNSIEGIIEWYVVWKSERNNEGLIEWYTEAVWKRCVNNKMIWRRKRERDIEEIIEDGEWKRARIIERIIEWYEEGKRERSKK